MYYACIESKKNGILKFLCRSKKAAQEYIAERFNLKEHRAAWIEPYEHSD